MTAAATAKVFNLGQVEQDRLAREINDAHSEIEARHTDILDRAINLGLLLSEAKQQAGHGQWLEWIKDHCKLSARHTSRYLLIAEHRDRLLANKTRVSDLSMRGIIELITTPKGRGDGRKHSRK